MVRRSLTVGLLAGVAALAVVLAAAPGCRSGFPKGSRADRLVVVSLDGLGTSLLDRWLADPTVATPEGLGGLADRGLKADRVRMVNPTLTMVNHASLITGALPSETGIVSNRFRTAGDPINRITNGYTAGFEAPALWVKAMAAGRRTAVLLWPGADFTSPERSADFGISWPNRPLVAAEILDFDPALAVPEPELPSSDGVESLKWRTDVATDDGVVLTLEVAVLDAQPDGRPRYQTVAVRSDPAGSYRYVAEREWFDTRVDVDGDGDGSARLFGAWSKILHLDAHRGVLRLYRGAFNALPAFPEAFSEAVTEAVGPWPGIPDNRGLEAWWLDMGEGIDLDTYVEQVERLDRYLDDIASWVMEHESFDLMLTYHPSPDEYLHVGLIVDRRQWAWSEGTAFAAREALDRCGRSLNRSVADLWARLDPDRDVLVVVSDHGQVPIHDTVGLNRALADAGLVETTERRGRLRIAPSSPMAAVTSGGMGHLYLNLKGRDPGGVVPEAEAADVLLRAAGVMADLGVDGEPVVEQVLSASDRAAYGLDHPNAGDLIVFLKPGYAASSRLDGPVIQPSRYYGQHGYLNHHDALCGIFMARGRPAGRGRLTDIRATEIEPKLERWLGLSGR